MTQGYTLFGFPKPVVYRCFIKDCSGKVHKIHRRALVPEFRFNKVAGLQLLWITTSAECFSFSSPTEAKTNWYNYLQWPIRELTNADITESFRVLYKNL